MPETTVVIDSRRDPHTIWRFVGDMNHWAPLLPGYQSHEVLSESTSTWRIRGDLGMMSRVVELSVESVEWAGPERVAFALTGLNEAVQGRGQFTIGTEGPEGVQPPAARQRPRWLQWVLTLFGWGQAPPKPLEVAGATDGGSRLTFWVEMDAGGPMGPVVNALLGPWLQDFAQPLGQRIVDTVENGNADVQEVAL